MQTPRKKKISPLTARIIQPNAAGVDIGATEIYIAVPADRDAQPVRCFPTFTADLKAAADWLRQCGITSVAMESTGVFFALSSALIRRVEVPPALR